MRDDRKLKHQGFFVNSGAVERIGDRVPVVAAARARNKKKRNLPVDGEEAQAGEQAAKPTKAASKGTNKAAKKVCNALLNWHHSCPVVFNARGPGALYCAHCKGTWSGDLRMPSHAGFRPSWSV